MAKRVIVIGGGPAGVMAALAAADLGARVMLWERNQQLGRKLAITGKGRCNITNASPPPELVKHIPGNGAFLYSAFSRFDADDTQAFFRDRCQLPLKVERGRRVFPQSDHAQDVVAALAVQLRAAGVEVVYGRRAKRLRLQGGRVAGVYDYNGTPYAADAVVVATGGVTYPATGSTGDGYALAADAGHSIVPPCPSLVPLMVEEKWIAQLAGLTLKNVLLSVYDGAKLLDKAFGEMLFAHTSLTGPIVLTLSKTVCAAPEQGRGLTLLLNLKPALNEAQLDARLQRNMQKYSRKIYQNSLGELLPSSLIPVFVELSGIAPDKPVHQISRAERRQIGRLLQALPFTVKGPGPLAEAVVTAGGVAVKEVDPKTMRSKLAEGLYFAGEVLDIDGYTGGYNLQAAWSSGFIAGQSAAL